MFGDESSKITLKRITTNRELHQAQQIRIEVLEHEQGFPHNVNIDGLDQSAIHVLLLDEENPVGTARLTKLNDKEGIIARIALLRSHQGKSLGKYLIHELEIQALQLGLTTLYIEPLYHLKPFFESIGYRQVNDFGKEGDHHLIQMEKFLSSV